jgi:hypothetical protein
MWFLSDSRIFKVCQEHGIKFGKTSPEMIDRWVIKHLQKPR